MEVKARCVDILGADVAKMRASMGFIGRFVLGEARVAVNAKERAANRARIGHEMLADFF